MSASKSKQVRDRLIGTLLKRATITLECESEDIPYVGNCSAIDAVTDREQESWIREQLASGNEWAWCQVTVRAGYRGFAGVDHLGACSYTSEASLREPGGYFDDLCWQACAEIADRLIEAISVLAELM